MVTLRDESGLIRSPIPELDGLYAYDTICSWKLIADIGYTSSLNILYINLPVNEAAGKPACEGNHVQVQNRLRAVRTKIRLLQK